MGKKKFQIFLRSAQTNPHILILAIVLLLVDIHTLLQKNISYLLDLFNYVVSGERKKLFFFFFYLLFFTTNPICWKVSFLPLFLYNFLILLIYLSLDADWNPAIISPTELFATSFTLLAMLSREPKTQIAGVTFVANAKMQFHQLR